MEVINQDTLLPISAVAVVVGVVIWLAKMWNRTLENKREVADLKKRVELIEAEHLEIAKVVTRLETKVDLILTALKVIPK